MREKEETLLWTIALEMSKDILAQDEKMSSCGNSEFVMRNAECGITQSASRYLFPIPYCLLPTASVG